MDSSVVRWLQGLLMALTLIGTATPDARSDEAIAWHETWDKAFRAARLDGRPLLVVVTRQQCPYCVRLKAETLADADVARMVSDRFVPLQVEGPRFPALLKRAGVRLYPTILLVSPDNRLVTRIDGYVDAPTLTTRLNEAQTEGSLAVTPGKTTAHVR
jgi:protein disulfide-isomerase